jgi:hypothetical protein
MADIRLVGQNVSHRPSVYTFWPKVYGQGWHSVMQSDFVHTI